MWRDDLLPGRFDERKGRFGFVRLFGDGGLTIAWRRSGGVGRLSS
jgi:hypothetical protein